MQDEQQDRDVDELEVARIGKPHGVRGAVRIHWHNPTSKTWKLVEGAAFKVRGNATEHVGLRFIQQGAAAEIKGVNDRDAAEALRGSGVWLRRELLAPTSADEFLYADLIGCEVVDQQHQRKGTIRDVFASGASDVLVIRCDGGERLVPFVEPWIGAVDLQRRAVTVVELEAFPLSKVR